MTDELRSYGVVCRELMPDVIRDTSQYANNRAEQSHEVTRVPSNFVGRFVAESGQQGAWPGYKPHLHPTDLTYLADSGDVLEGLGANWGGCLTLWPMSAFIKGSRNLWPVSDLKTVS